MSKLKEIEKRMYKDINPAILYTDACWLLTKLHLCLEALATVQERMEEAPYKDSPRVTATSAQIREVIYAVKNT